MGSRLFFLIAIGVSYFAHAAEISPREWADELVKHELTALEQSFEDAAIRQSISRAKADRAKAVARLLKRYLSENPSEQALQSSSAVYVALTNTMTVARLRSAVDKNHPVPQSLIRAQAQAEGILSVLHVNPTKEEQDLLLAQMHNLEETTERAKEDILLQKRAGALRTAVLRLEVLAKLEPDRKTGYLKGATLLKQAMKEAASANLEASNTSTTAALTSAFGKLAESWDGRHLWHYAQLRSMALGILSSSDVPEADRKEIQQTLASLAAVTSDEEYDLGARDLQERAAEIITRYDLNTTHPDLILYTAPDRVQESLVEKLSAMRSWIPEVKQSFDDNETFLQSFRTTQNKRMHDMMAQMSASFDAAATSLALNTSADVLENFQSSSHLLQTITLYTAEAILDRSDSAAVYFHAWRRGIDRLTRGQPFLTKEDNAVVFKALRIERREGVRRAWLNRHNATVAAMSVLLVAEAVAIPFTGGGSAAAMPATLHAIMTVSVVSAKTVLITNSALNITDRAKIKGVKGLVNMDTAFDALIILTMMPRPVIGGAPAQTMLGKLGQSSLRRIADLQYSAGVVLGVAGTGYGSYLIYNAETIAKDMQREGIAISPADIRRKGLVNVALGILALQTNASWYRRGVQTNGEGFKQAMEPYTVTGGSIPRFLQQFRQIHTLKQMWASSPGFLGKMMVVGKGVGYALVDFLLVTEGALFSYTNLDLRYFNKTAAEHPLPELEGDETAVVVVGFEPADYFLYAGALAPYSNRQEIRKYGKKLFIYPFTSPENLMDVLSWHRDNHGPVKYLKISTHGRPGRLFTAAVSATPEEGRLIKGQGWIDQYWLTFNREELQEQSRRIFAKDTRVRLFACLVGANLDKDRGEGTDIGDKFLTAMGETLLVNGGSIDASTRVLLGLDITVGALSDYAIKESLKPSAGEAPPLTLPVTQYEQDEWTGLSTIDAPWKVEFESTLESGKALAERLKGILLHWPPIWWEFGVNLEGPFWQSRYKYREFPAR